MAASVALDPSSTSFPSPNGNPTTPPSSDLYQPLPPHSNTVRLLEIQPGTLAEPIHCHLFSSSLDPSLAPPSYEAISYVWGCPDLREPVRCNDTTISITSNLADALRRFRSPTDGRVVWADGICINQADDREKGHQVRLMRMIYKRAARVLVWLGRPAPGDEQQPRAAFDALCALANQTRAAGEPPAAWDDEQPSPAITTTSSSTRRTDPDDSLPPSQFSSGTANGGRKRTSALLADRWAALAPFYALPWFRRVWVIQEIALSSASTALHWGLPPSSGTGARIAWSHVARATDRIVALKHRLPLHRLPGALHAHLMGSLWQAEQRRNGSRIPLMTTMLSGDGDGDDEERMTFEELHAKTVALSFVASDPRDRVYALLGIPTRETEPDDGVLYLEPDYGVNLVEPVNIVACWDPPE
ncbi:hypothetical protein SLS55_003642 [Diplodia seriata]|uniref:Heterokaryon incompatibility domain-containing protein n=1 Tax=Diplodia seriata TaxID=420778 RepID=A0ABR3CNJ2_9PEZI